MNIEALLKNTPYAYLSTIGKGGMGEVYLAYHNALERQVAIKIIAQEDSPPLNERLRREALSLAQINHANVVQIYDYIDTPSLKAIVMEYVEGKNLKLTLRETAVDFQKKLFWIKDICSGLCAIHSNGLIHRDLKAENILINTESRAKITDFGLVKKNKATISPETNTGEILGSYSALSPEQALGKALDSRSDLFSLGILMYHLLFNRHPFGDEAQPLALIDGIINREPIPVETHQAPSALTKLIFSLLNKEPDARPQCINTVITRLNTLTSNRDFEEKIIQTAPLSSRTRNQTPRKAQRAITHYILAASILISSPLIFWLYQTYFALRNQYYVALPNIKINGDIPIPHAKILVDAIDFSLQESILQHPDLFLISPKEIRETTGNHSERAVSTSTDGFIEAEVSCNKIRCNLSLHLIEQDKDNSPWMIKRQTEIAILFDSKMLNVSDDIQHHVFKLFPTLSPTRELPGQIDSNLYEWFLQKRYDILVAQNSSVESWEEMIRADPRLLNYPPYLELLHSLALELYDNTQDVAYFDVLESILSRSKSKENLRLKTLYFDIAINRQDFISAEKELQSLRKQRNDPARQALMEATLLQRQGHFKKADGLFKKAYALRPSAALLYDIGLNYWSQGDTEEAAHFLEAAIRNSPNYRKPKSLLAAIHLFNEEYEKATMAYQQLIRDFPIAQHYNNMGLAYVFQGKFESALRAFENAVKLTPENPTHLLNLADGALLTGDQKRAYKYYKKIIEITKNRLNDWEYAILYSQANAHTGNTSQALSAVLDSLQLALDNPEVLYSAALVYCLAKQYPVSLSYIEKSIAAGVPASWFSLPWFDPIRLHHKEALAKAIQKNTNK